MADGPRGRELITASRRLIDQLLVIGPAMSGPWWRGSRTELLDAAHDLLDVLNATLTGPDPGGAGGNN